MSPKISVVVPAYNEEKYIARCLEALREQSYGSYEVIVVDNASTDATSKVAMEFADRVVHEPQKGVARARQRGWKEACGEIVAFTDADTIVLKNWLDVIEASLQNDALAVYGPVYLDCSGLNGWLARHGFTLFLKINHFVRRPNIVGSNFAAKRSALDAVGGFDVTAPSAEDVELGLRLLKLGKIEFNQNMIVHTSARRLKAGYWRFFKHHALNYASLMLSGKTKRGFDDIR